MKTIFYNYFVSRSLMPRSDFCIVLGPTKCQSKDYVELLCRVIDMPQSDFCSVLEVQITKCKNNDYCGLFRE